MKVYLDNAATTPLDPEVIKAMLPVLNDGYGNPSSIHTWGREARSMIEHARKTVAGLLNCAPGEIFFTSGGTEANNMALRCSVQDLGIRHVISSPIEHHAVLNTLEEMEKRGLISLTLMPPDARGHIDLQQLEDELKAKQHTLVSLMHANNELGNLHPVQEIGQLCKAHGALFHSDTVQTMGHFPMDLQQWHADFLSAGAHKFHGPKGVGFIYISSRVKIEPFITGGSQERNMRGGTENIYGIIGMAKALELSYRKMDAESRYIKGLREYMAGKLRDEIPGLAFNTDLEEESLYTILNVSFPPCDFAEMLLFNLDIEGIAASGGSACSSGSDVGSHVLTGVKADPARPAVRFSFSKFNTREEIDFTVDKLKEMFLVKA